MMIGHGVHRALRVGEVTLALQFHTFDLDLRRFQIQLRAQGIDRCFESDGDRSEEHTSELQSRSDLVCRLLLEKKKKNMWPAASYSTDIHEIDLFAALA